MTPAAFHRDATLRELTVPVLERAEAPRPFVLLADTVLYPEGGGQPRDHGTVDGVEVVGLVATPDGFRHDLAAPVLTPRVTVAVDWARRHDHMQQHTAQHLLSAIAEDRFGLVTTSFHLGPEVSDVELDRPDLPLELRHDLEEAVAVEIEAARPVSARFVEPTSVPRAVRSRGLPEGHEGLVRLVEIAGIDCATCGGTHVSRTSEIGGFALLTAETMRGGTRLTWVAGDRWRSRLARQEAILGELRRRLDGRNDELPALVDRRLDELARVERALRRETGRLAKRIAGELARRDAATLVTAHLAGRDGAFLRMVAGGIADDPRPRLWLLTAEREGEGFFLLAGPAGDPRVAALGPLLAGRLEGRGGGRGNVFQGRAGDLSGREEAAAWLRSELGSAPAETQGPEGAS